MGEHALSLCVVRLWRAHPLDHVLPCYIEPKSQSSHIALRCNTNASPLHKSLFLVTGRVSDAVKLMTENGRTLDQLSNGMGLGP
jgi:hypothetical protein